MFAIQTFRIARIVLAISLTFIVNASVTSAHAQSRTIASWLDFKFDARASMGDAKNPAVILPSDLAALFSGVAGAKRVGNTVFVPAVEFQKAARQPLASILLGHFLDNFSNVKSFDGFNAVDMTGVIKNLPSEI